MVARDLSAEEIFDRGSEPVSAGQTGEMSVSVGVKSFPAALSEMRATVLREQHVPRLTTGFPTLDRAMRGIQPGEVLAILGRPGCLKTQLSLTVIDAMLAQRPAGAFLLVNLEMPASQLVMRQARMHFQKTEKAIEDALRRDALDVADFTEAHRNLFIADRGAMSLEQVELAYTDTLRLIHPMPIDAVVIDHCGLIRSSRGASAYERASETAVGGKQLARSLSTIVIELVQANRGAKNDNEPVPIEGARDSGAYEENADFILSLGQLVDESGRLPYIKGRLVKNRRGPCVPMAFTFDPISMRMHELAEEFRG
jgi:replicative DNA helicase